MELTHRIDGGLTRITLAGNLDVTGADRIGLAFNALAGTGTRMLVDLAGVGFISSMGIRLILTVAKAVIRRGGRMVLLNPVPAVKDVLVTTGIDQMIPIHSSAETALAALAP